LALAHALLLSVVILPPTVLMGAALPLGSRWRVRRAEVVAGPVGGVYAWNTLGAVVGASATGFLLLPTVGLRAAVLLAAAAQVTIGVFLIAARLPAVQTVAATDSRPQRPRRWSLLASLFFLCGFSGLGLEVIWTRYLSLILENTIHTYTLTLTVVLAGIVLGAGIASRLFDRRLPLARIFGAMQILLAIVAVRLFELPPAFWQSLGGAIPSCMTLLLPAAVLSGASFPLVARMAIDLPERAGGRVGGLAAINTLGGILGAPLAGFVLVPRFGLEGSVRLVAGASLAAGVVAWLHLDAAVRVGRRVAVALLAVGLFATAALAPGTRVPADFLAAGRELVDYREGREGHLAVVREQDGQRVLEIDRWWQGQEGRTHQVVAAHLPMLLHPDPRRVLCIGVGAGQTPSRFLMYDVERVDCVDIEPVLFELIRRHFDASWMDDPRVHLVHADGRALLAHATGGFEVISIEIGQTFRPGAAGFYTADFYAQAAERLAPGGILVQFVPLMFLTPETLRGVVRTFIEIFPASQLWYNTGELLLIGARERPVRLDQARLGLVSTSPAVNEDLRWAYWGGRDFWLNDPAVFLGGFLAGPVGLARLARGGPIYRDDRPILEYAAVAAARGETRELTLLPLLREALDPVEEALQGRLVHGIGERARAVRDGNLRQIAADALLRSVTLESPDAVSRVRAALAHHPGSLRTWRILGDALYLAGDAAGASQAYAEVLGRGLPVDEEARAHRGLGLALAAQRRFREAVDHYRIALGPQPEDPQLHNMLGAALGLDGDLQGAIEHFSEALRLNPDYDNARRNLEATRAALERGATGG
jgi:spermidine synthase